MPPEPEATEFVLEHLTDRRPKYCAAFKVDSHILNFRVFKVVAWDDAGKPIMYGGSHRPVESMGEAEVFVDGFIKWDGCSNFEFGPPGIMVHFCDREQAVGLGQLLGWLYDVAAETIPSWSP